MESSIGIRALKPIDNITKAINRDFGDVKEVVALIKKYLVLNYKIEKTVLSILKSLVSLVKERYKIKEAEI
ncbi:hypothetical protein ABES23_14675 [Peribacillus frigoritolerans]|uniref:hypothetical protein n=1 Tax=Peribacillus frigoritolerans TaxID=450367 RepID=UPI003D284F0A